MEEIEGLDRQEIELYELEKSIINEFDVLDYFKSNSAPVSTNLSPLDAKISQQVQQQLSTLRRETQKMH